MADEVSKRDQNRKTVVLGITNDSNQYTTMIRVDPSTLRLLVNATISGTPTITGTVDVSSVIPGTGATNLGKARGSAVGATDVGVAALFKYQQEPTVTTLTNNQYGVGSLTDYSELRTRDQRELDLQNCDVYTDFTALSNDTTGIASSANHVFGTAAVTFNKVNGTDNKVYGGVSATITAVNLSDLFESGGFIGLNVYLPSLTNVVDVFVRAGTNASNYNEWTWDASLLTALSWLSLRQAIAQPNYSRNAGNGWNPASITYVAFGVTFSLETDTLSGIVFDHAYIVGGRISAADLSAAISSSVSTPNINLLRVSNSAAGVAGNGIVQGGTQRVTIASDSTGQVKLTTGTSEIGFVKNAGTFAVQLTNKSVIGAGDPTVDSYNTKAISAAANTADQELIATPGANKQIWVYGIGYVVGTAAGTVSFQDSDDTAISGVMSHALNSGMGISPSGNYTMPIWKVATNKALEVDTVTCDIKGWISYAVVSV